ncbi:epididymal-specific lipocalin-9 [Tamandua tetradactyla]|uniref:epididymal-specific lipocalin-9 n=1 Tax=Tamandua tetradactyla TaxID=48850 RepID=UPI0040544DAC
MALLLLTVGLGLGSAQPLDLHPVVHQNFNLTKVAGDWSSISMASDDLTRIQPNGDLRLFVRTIKNFNNGSLKFDFKLSALAPRGGGRRDNDGRASGGGSRAAATRACDSCPLKAGWVHGECVTAAVVCERTRTGGVFTIAYEGHNTVRLLETDYELYITFYLQNTRNGTETRVLALYDL